MRPHFFTARSTTSPALPLSERSATWDSASSSRAASSTSALRSTSNTPAPAPARALAMESPMPPAAPDTTPTFPSMFSFIACSPAFRGVDDPGFYQVGYGLGAIAGLGEDLFRVFSKSRGYLAQGRGLLVVADGMREQAHRPCPGVFEGKDRAVGGQLRVVLYIRVVVHRGVPDAGLVEDFVPVAGRLLFHVICYLAVDLLPFAELILACVVAEGLVV